MRNTQANVAVALLYQTQELERHVRDALASLGTTIVYEAPAANVDPEALENSGARVVVVNLDPAVEAHLDEVYRLLEDDRYSVVFNDAQVSSGLSGWDQARWARHLAAKILGDADIDPPRPEGAEPIPAPAPVERPQAAEAEPIEPAEPHEADEPALLATAEPEAAPLALEPAHAESAEAPAPDPLGFLESRFDEMNRPAEADFPTPAPPPPEEFDFSTLEALTAAPSPPPAPDASGFELDFLDEPDEDEPSPPKADAPSEPENTFDLSALDDLLAEVPTSREKAAESIDVGDLGQFGDLEATDLDAPAERIELESPPELSLFDDAPLEASATNEERAKAPAPPSSTLAAAADWSLEDMLDEGAAPPAAPGKPSDFGIEKMSAAEYLAPDTEGTAPPPVPDQSFDFELVPLEEAVAPQPVEQMISETWLDPDKVKALAKIRRVWVLGASIGGPEAVRAFLAEIPREYPALFLLAQHMGAEFVDLMAQQLAKATPLTVRTPTHGERVGHGEVVIVPTTHRLQVDPEGIIVLERVASEEAYSPSIDRVLRDAADRYGAKAGAIIFSGMTTDAIEGSAYLASKGGAIYAQHPDTCVVSSMVDGVVETGVVKFLGSPKELAEQLIAEAAKK